MSAHTGIRRPLHATTVRVVLQSQFPWDPRVVDELNMRDRDKFPSTVSHNISLPLDSETIEKQL